MSNQMKEEPLDFKLIEMLNTPICKMDGKEQEDPHHPNLLLFS